jgi:hypothetical protein
MLIRNKISHIGYLSICISSIRLIYHMLRVRMKAMSYFTRACPYHLNKRRVAIRTNMNGSNEKRTQGEHIETATVQGSKHPWRKCTFRYENPTSRWHMYFTGISHRIFVVYYRINYERSFESTSIKFERSFLSKIERWVSMLPLVRRVVETMVSQCRVCQYLTVSIY